MTVTELISKLQTLPQDYVVEFNNEAIGEVFALDDEILCFDKSIKGFNEQYDTPSVILFAANYF